MLTSSGELGPLETVEQRELVSLGLLTLLERLTPAERAVFVLREAFGYSHREVAEVMDLSQANCRQLLRRAGRHLSEQVRRFPAKPQGWQRLVAGFLDAAQNGNVAGLERVLSEDVTARADGGGQVGAARRAIVGRARVARYLTGIAGKFGTGVRISMAEVNAEPAALAWRDETLLSVIVVETHANQIRALRTIANPDKLRFAEQQAAALSHTGSSVGS